MNKDATAPDGYSTEDFTPVEIADLTTNENGAGNKPDTDAAEVPF